MYRQWTLSTHADEPRVAASICVAYLPRPSRAGIEPKEPRTLSVKLTELLTAADAASGGGNGQHRAIVRQGAASKGRGAARLVLVKSRSRDVAGQTVDSKTTHTKKTAARMKPPLEHEVQSKVISWARATAYLQDDPLKRLALEIYHSIPNGARVIRMQKPILHRRTGRPLPPREALLLKAEGLTPGIEDTFLDWPQRCEVLGVMLNAGFYIEYKRPGEKPEPHQLAMMEAHRRLGYRSAWYDCPTRAAEAIIEQMALKVWSELPELKEWRKYQEQRQQRRKAA
jgi:hypothetical protein